jgi:hypothetical protein
MKKRLSTLIAAGVAILVADSASAQSLVDQMRELFLQSVVLSTTPGGVGIVAHTPVFVNDARVLEATTLIDQISQQIGSQVSLFPLGSSSAGFTYAYDSSLGTFNRTTQTFGPAFAERTATVGKGKYSFDTYYIHTQYKALDGFGLDDGSIKINLRHQALSPPSFVEGDVIQAALNMNLKSDSVVFLFNAGITDRLDIGVAVPVIHVAMDLTYHATILDFATHNVSPTTHVFSDGSKTRDFSSTGSASGVGDMIIRGKYNVMNTPAGGVGAGVELKLPTGDADNMLGAGATQARFYFIGSGGRGRSLAHVNFGYTASSSEASNQINYVGGVEYAASPKVTVVGDLLGWNLRDSIRLHSAATPIAFQQGPAAPVETTTVATVALSSGSLSTAFGTAGVKLNPTGNLLISAHVLFPLTTSSGLKSGVSPVLGFEYSF